MKKANIYLTAMSFFLVITGWSIGGLVMDLTGNDILDPAKHMNWPELAWTLVFAGLAYYCYTKAKLHSPSKKKR